MILSLAEMTNVMENKKRSDMSPNLWCWRFFFKAMEF